MLRAEKGRETEVQRGAESFACAAPETSSTLVISAGISRKEAQAEHA